MQKAWKVVEMQKIFGRKNYREENNTTMNVQRNMLDHESSGSGMWAYGLNRAGSGQGQVASTCECSNELSGSIKCVEYLDQLLKKDPAPQSK